MSEDEKARLEAEVTAAREAVALLRAENAELAAAFRADPSDAGRELLKRAAARLASARDGLDAAQASLAVFEKTGSPYGLIAKEGSVTGTVAVLLPPGTSQKARGAAIEAVIGARLDEAAQELGVVLTAAPVN
jgi:hypothetical protein